MKKETLYEALREIDPQYIDSAAPKNRRRYAPVLRAIAVAAAIMLLAAGMIVALPLLRTNPELPPDPATDPVIGESTTEEKDETMKIDIDADMPFWLNVANSPFAVIDNIEVTDEIFTGGHYSNGNQMKYRKIKCNVIFSVNTEIYGISDADFKNTEFIFVPESAIDTFKKETSVLFSVKREFFNRNGYGITLPHDKDGVVYYVPIINEKLSFSDKDGYNPFIDVNNQIEYHSFLLSIDEKYAEIEIIKVFPKKAFVTGMTVNELIDNYFALKKAEEVFLSIINNDKTTDY